MLGAEEDTVAGDVTVQKGSYRAESRVRDEDASGARRVTSGVTPVRPGYTADAMRYFAILR